MHSFVEVMKDASNIRDKQNVEEEDGLRSDSDDSKEITFSTHVSHLPEVTPKVEEMIESQKVKSLGAVLNVRFFYC